MRTYSALKSQVHIVAWPAGALRERWEGAETLPMVFILQGGVLDPLPQRRHLRRDVLRPADVRVAAAANDRGLAHEPGVRCGADRHREQAARAEALADTQQQFTLVADAAVGDEHDLPQWRVLDRVVERAHKRRPHLGAPAGGERAHPLPRAVEVRGHRGPAVGEQRRHARVELDDVEHVVGVQLVESPQQCVLRLHDGVAAGIRSDR